VSRILYFDCFSGISGDMTLGALIDAGLPVADLQRALGSLALGQAHVHARKVLRAGVSATQLIVHAHDHGGPQHHHEPGDGHHHVRDDDVHARHPHRSLGEIFDLIDRSALSPAGRERAKAMFQRLGEIEAAIHQMPVEKVHLHEVGALDSIIDIVGTVFGMEWVGADQVVCSPLNVGGGMVESAHGLFPVPAPATVNLLGGAPVYGGGAQTELVTPTGALIATTFAGAFGPLPRMTIERVGYGAGSRDEPRTPNVLRILIGTPVDPVDNVDNIDRIQTGTDRVTVIECEIDDMNPQIYGVAMERLYAAGALEVFYIPVQMKKNRPGTLLTVVGPPERHAELARIVFTETTTIGLRHYEVERECLEREIVSVETPLGAVRFKIARRDGHVMNATPEFDDCARLADANHLALKEVQAIAIRAYKS
jgi:hypothetical protein